MNIYNCVIIASYLLITMIIGMRAGKGVKDLRDFALGSRNYTTLVLTLTLCATDIGGASSIGAAAQIYECGVIAIIGKLLGTIIWVILGCFVAPKITLFFGKITAGEIMGEMYGRSAQVLTGVTGVLFCIYRMGLQIMTLGFIFEVMIGISFYYGVIISSLIVVIYASFGGIRSVIYTDILQFITVSITVPIALNMGLKLVGGYYGLFSIVNYNYDFLNPTHHQAPFKYGFLLFYMAFPIFSPPLIQRMLMARDASQIRKSFIIFSIVDLGVTVCSCMIGFLAYVIFPHLEPNAAYIGFVSQILPDGIKVFAVIGILSLIMSTADSYLNVISISIMHDILAPLGVKIQEKYELLVLRFLSVGAGCAALVVALYFNNLFELSVIIINFWGPIIYGPFMFGLFGFRTSYKTVLFAAACAALAFVIWDCNYKQYFLPSAPAVVVNIISFFGFHYITKQRGGWLYEKKPLKFNLSNKLNDLLSYPALQSFSNFNNFLNERAYSYGMPAQTFCSFLIISYIFPFLIWHEQQSYNLIIIKFISGILASCFLLKDIWAERFKSYEAIYWYIMLLISLPVLSVITICDSGFTDGSLVISSLSVLLLSLLVDWVMFLILMVLGYICGVIYFFLPHSYVMLNLYEYGYSWTIYTVIFSFAIGFIFSRNREQQESLRIKAAQSIGAVIAHEIKNPLVALKMYSLEIKKNLSASKLDKIEHSAQVIEKVVSDTWVVIDIILNRLNYDNIYWKHSKNLINIRDIIKSAVAEYPMNQETRDIIKIDIHHDFQFYGNELLFKHVIFNLLQNAIYYLNKNKNPQIIISTAENSKYNIIYFYDNARGIKPEALKYLFNSFYTNKDIGTGLGLFFCRKTIESFKGMIQCESVYGEYTKFIISLPKATKCSVSDSKIQEEIKIL